MYRPQKNISGGFTLIELIVAVGVFTVIATLAVGSLLVMIDAEEKVFNVQTNQDNVRFVLEAMGRSIRTGIFYNKAFAGYPNQCTTGQHITPPGTDCFEFLAADIDADGDDDHVVYRRDSGAGCGVGYPAGSGCIVREINPGTAEQSILPMTSPEVDISQLSFYINGNEDFDERHPRVTIVLRAETPQSSFLSSELIVQTTISQFERD